MFGILARLFVVFAIGMIASDVVAHDSWISRGGHRNAAGEWCCGEGDCFVVAPDRIVVTAGGYAIVGQTAGVGDAVPVELVPFSEAQPSPDGQFWRCKRPDGSRRCFFAPPPNT
jgi:hypothetical protein